MLEGDVLGPLRRRMQETEALEFSACGAGLAQEWAVSESLLGTLALGLAAARYKVGGESEHLVFCFFHGRSELGKAGK